MKITHYNKAAITVYLTSFLKDGKNLINLGFNVADVLADYVGNHSPVNPQLEGRIIRLEGN